MSKELITLSERLKVIGITVEYAANYPWIYLDKINGKRVKEKHFSEHGFTIAFFPAKIDQQFKFVELSVIFNLIREYINEDEVECNMCGNVMYYDEKIGVYLCGNSSCTRCYDEEE